ncbi:hypothetical protein GS03_02406 [Flavobacterium sangjuense]|uniref:Uncharacterized protein n=1 Tax=Flavobacterium sangjuense TaxID=2518177 RepID=A0A4V1CCB4_9FLAO|nr:hypothetical protein GS03_02406 [Flavobacterium sangjuense]
MERQIKELVCHLSFGKPILIMQSITNYLILNFLL